MDNLETDKQILDRINYQFTVLEKMTKATIDGTVRGLVISGPGGIGKSHGVIRILKEVNEKRIVGIKSLLELSKSFFNKDKPVGPVIKPFYQIISSYIRPPSLYKALYDYRNFGEVTVFDDCDSVMDDEISLNILKTALDTNHDRVIDYRAESNAIKGYEKQFSYKGGTIFITNKRFDQENGRLGDQLKALLTRTHYIDLHFDPRDKLIQLRYVAKHSKMLKEQGFSEIEENEILDFISENSENLNDLSLRMVVKIASLRKIDRINWREMAKQTCMKRQEGLKPRKLEKKR